MNPVSGGRRALNAGLVTEKDRWLAWAAGAVGTIAVVALVADAVVRGLPLPLVALLGVGGAAMVAATVCDMRERRIPRVCCYVLAVAGGAFQLARFGPMVIGVMAAVSLCTVGLPWLIARTIRREGENPVLGAGDVRCMAALTVATGFGALLGAVACCLGASVSALIGLATGRIGLRDGMPFAPFLLLWFLVGSTACLP